MPEIDALISAYYFFDSLNSAQHLIGSADCSSEAARICSTAIVSSSIASAIDLDTFACSLVASPTA